MNDRVTRSAWNKGCWVGFANVIVVVLVVLVGGATDHFGALLGGSIDWPNTTLWVWLVAIAAVLFNGFVAKLAAETYESPLVRGIACGAPAMAFHFVLVAPFGPELVLPALLPTVAASLVIEHWTRPTSWPWSPRPPVVVRRRAEPDGISAYNKGRLLGLVNVFVVATLIAIDVANGFEWRLMENPSSALDAFLIVAIGGCLPAAYSGGMLGIIASTLEDRPWARKAEMFVLSIAFLLANVVVAVFGLVVFLGCSHPDALVLFAPALGPTVALGWVLERWARRVPPIAPARISASERRSW